MSPPPSLHLAIVFHNGTRYRRRILIEDEPQNDKLQVGAQRGVPIDGADNVEEGEHVLLHRLPPVEGHHGVVHVHRRLQPLGLVALHAEVFAVGAVADDLTAGRSARRRRFFGVVTTSGGRVHLREQKIVIDRGGFTIVRYNIDKEGIF